MPAGKIPEKRILHVEDGDKWHREVLRAAPRSWKVDQAPDKNTALKLLAERNYDGVILDANFPENRGEPYEDFGSVIGKEGKPRPKNFNYGSHGVPLAGRLFKKHVGLPVVVFSDSETNHSEMITHHAVDFPFVNKVHHGGKEAVRVLKQLLRKQNVKQA